MRRAIRVRKKLATNRQNNVVSLNSVTCQAVLVGFPARCQPLFTSDKNKSRYPPGKSATKCQACYTGSGHSATDHIDSMAVQLLVDFSPSLQL